MKLYEFFNEDKDNVTALKPQTKGTKYPLFSKENIQKAYNEYADGAEVDRDIDIVGKDNKEYVIRQNYDGASQHFEEGEWYLTDANNEIVDPEGYPDPGELLYDHNADEEFYPTDPNEGMEEGTRCWKGYKKKGTKKMFGKTVPNCVKNEMYDQDDFDDVFGDRKYKNEFAYLDDLRDSGATNMYGASAYLVRDLGLDKAEADKILVRWMRSKEDKDVSENFADGKKKGKSKPGRVKKAGASCNGSVTSLRKKAKNSSGEKSKMYHWCANMKSGRKKK